MFAGIIFGLGQSLGSSCHGLASLEPRLLSAIPKLDGEIYEWNQPGIAEGLAYARQPRVLIGHSFGGARAVGVCDELAKRGREVDWLFLLDPVPTKGWGFCNFKDFRLPANVKRATCWWRSPLLPPWSHPIREGHYFENIKKKISHEAFCSDQDIHHAIETRCLWLANEGKNAA